MSEVGSDIYAAWTDARVRAILSIRPPQSWSGITVLELGCRHADGGAFFACLGAHVTAVDARPGHIVRAQARHPLVNSRVHDVRDPWSLGDYDVVLHLGLAYHMGDPVRSVREACEHCGELYLESQVVDHPGEVCRLVGEHSGGDDQSMDGRGSETSAVLYEGVMRAAGMTVTRLTPGDVGIHRYGWPHGQGDSGPGLRRMWAAWHPGRAQNGGAE